MRGRRSLPHRQHENDCSQRQRNDHPCGAELPPGPVNRPDAHVLGGSERVPVRVLVPVLVADFAPICVTFNSVGHCAAILSRNRLSTCSGVRCMMRARAMAKPIRSTSPLMAAARRIDSSAVLGHRKGQVHNANGVGHFAASFLSLHGSFRRNRTSVAHSARTLVRVSA